MELDTTAMGSYERGGIVLQVKEGAVRAFKPLAQALKEPGEFLLSDFSKFDRPPKLHLLFQVRSPRPPAPQHSLLDHRANRDGCDACPIPLQPRASTYAVAVWALCLVQGPFSVAPVPNPNRPFRLDCTSPGSVAVDPPPNASTQSGLAKVVLSAYHRVRSKSDRCPT
jgi:hypothetical protein